MRMLYVRKAQVPGNLFYTTGGAGVLVSQEVAHIPQLVGGRLGKRKTETTHHGLIV
jgi:hypothetical protein